MTLDIRILAASLALSPIATMFAAGGDPLETKFAPPVQLNAGGKLLGGGRLYPSPVFHDINKDGIPDIVVGDLRGRITIALRSPGNDPLAFAAETELNAADGKVLDFHNW
jgi:hypothetical protein